MKTGDYCLENDEHVVIDTKYGMQEVYGDIIQDHRRFKAEMLRAQEDGQRFIVLVEEDIGDLEGVKEWRNPRITCNAFRKQGKKPPVSSERLYVMMRTMSERYGVEWQFCAKKDTGKRIVELLTEGNDEYSEQSKMLSVLR